MPWIAPGISSPEAQVSPVSQLLAWPPLRVFVFQGFSYIIREGECCGRCLPSACKIEAGSLRGDSHSAWKSVGSGPGGGGEEGAELQPGNPFCCPSVLAWFSSSSSLLLLQELIWRLVLLESQLGSLYPLGTS